jgi:glycosyltransferase involved in cell wall biosynthesis
MKIKRLHQFSAGFNPGDAISNQMLLIQSHCERYGIKGEIYSENISPSQKKGFKYRSYSPKKGDCILYHHSIHSGVLDYLLRLDIDIPKILLYHNVTPHNYFQNYDLQMTYYLKKGREELKSIKDRFTLNLAVSDFNKAELESIGFRDVKKYPIHLDLNSYPVLEKKSPKNKVHIIFIGRIAPNKKQEDLIKFAKIFQELYQLDFELQLVGYTSKELYGYRDELENLIRYLHLEDRVKICGFLSQEDLGRYYSQADVFLCMSEHEGFCVPLMEAMHYQIPIVAYSAGAIPETLGGAGILVQEKNFPLIAGIVYKLISDSSFRQKVIRGQILVYRKYLEYSNLENIFKYISKI